MCFHCKAELTSLQKLNDSFQSHNYQNKIEAYAFAKHWVRHIAAVVGEACRRRTVGERGRVPNAEIEYGLRAFSAMGSPRLPSFPDAQQAQISSS